MTVEVFNVLGQKVRTVLDRDLATGAYSVAWDGRDDSGAQAPAGMYFARIVGPGVQEATRIVIAR